MDDETFKKEVLARLDQIVELLAAALPEACLVETQGEQEPGEAQPKAPVDPLLYLVGDEMKDEYAQAVKKWQGERAPS